MRKNFEKFKKIIHETEKITKEFQIPSMTMQVIELMK